MTTDLYHFSVHDASGIAPGSEANYLWFNHAGIFYPDLHTYQADPYPENWVEVAEQRMRDDDPRPQYE